MVTLDFSQCKTKEDVEKVFKENKEELEVVKDLKHKVGEIWNVQIVIMKQLIIL